MARANQGKAMEHAWRYFSLHANQRMTVFNFFIILSGILTAGIAATLQGPPRFTLVGIGLSLLLSALACVFWQFDRRSCELIKRAETCLSNLELEMSADGADLFTQDAAATARRFTDPWTYGRSLRIVFGTMFIFGIAAGALCALRFEGVFDWR